MHRSARLAVPLTTLLFSLAPAFFTASFAKSPATSPATNPATNHADVGELIPSEDSLIKDLHSLGLIDGRTDIFRCACPVRDIAKKMATTQPTDDDIKLAIPRLQRLYDLGIRTDISFQDPHGGPGDETKSHETIACVNLERAAAQAVGIRFVSHPIANTGPGSLQTMTDDQVLALLTHLAAEVMDDSKTAGVVFHCSAGHDRTGLLAAFIRLKYEHWSVDQAIAEMRRLGHNWPKYSANAGLSSWHEDHLRAISKMLPTPETN